MDVVDQALMRGLATAFPIVPPGLSQPYDGRRREAGHKASDGRSLPWPAPADAREEMPAAAGV